MPYTPTGKNHINLHLAGQVPAVATHIGMGIDLLNTTGDTPPLLSDRYLSAFQSALLPITNSTLVGSDIVFATSYDTAPVPMLLGNTMGLIYMNQVNASTVRIRKNMFNDFENWQNTVDLVTSNTPSAWPSEDGGMIIALGNTAYNKGSFSLSSYEGHDILSIPVFFYGGSPSSGQLSFKFHFTINGQDKYYTLGDSITSSGSYYKFANGSPALNNGVTVTTDLKNPQPTVWQKRLDAGTTDKDLFFKNLDSITQVDMTWLNAGTGCSLYVGSPQITPDYDADSSNIVVAWGKLSNSVVHPGHTYLSAEYRIKGIEQIQ